MTKAATLINFVRKSLPIGAALVNAQNPYEEMPVKMVDIDGDGIPEIIAAYMWQGNPFVLVLKNHNNLWYKMADIEGIGYNISYLNFADVTGSGIKDLLIGWQVGAIWSELNIFQVRNAQLNRIISDVMYSRIEVENIPSQKDIDGKVRIALWNHDTGEAYKVDLLRWEDSKLVPAKESYPYYFKKVVEYYKEKVEQMPKAAFYWYYLGDAQIKAEMQKEAEKSIEIGLKINQDYPSKEAFQELIKNNKVNLRINSIERLLASISTIHGFRWGYIDRGGEFVIKPLYNWARQFQDNGLAVITIKDLSGIIDKRGKYIVKPKYQSIQEFSEGLAVVVSKSGFMVIDEKGIEVTGEVYNYIGSFREGRAVFSIISTDGTWLYGYINRKGNISIPPKYEIAGDFKNGKAVVKLQRGNYAIIEANGVILKEFKYAFVSDIGEGLLSFKENDKDGYGYIDEAGNVVIAAQFASAETFKSERAVVNTSANYLNKYGLIDKKGNFIVSPKYNNIELLGEGRASVGIAISKKRPYIGSKYAIVDIDGKFLTDFIYYGVSNYKNKLASAYDNSKTFFINEAGKKISKLPIIQGNGILSFIGDIIVVQVDNRIAYLYKAGDIIWSQNGSIKLNEQYTIKEKKYKPSRNFLVYYPQINGMDNNKIEGTVNKKLKEKSQVRHIDSSEEIDYNYYGQFVVEFFQKELLVLQLSGYNYPFGAAHGMPTEIYPHVDLSSGRFYELEDLFKQNSNFALVLSDIIRKQIEDMGPDSGIWIDQYKGIKNDQLFYVSEEVLNIYFTPYEIAPYAYGFPTFKIPYEEIMNIIDTEGVFWNSFK
ncbi:WG repeat-containing protein [Clostridium bowmanii]|uniref:WG repeat-containing protein n=1 Tax=Clostridium bowmanii TaxID=132925 RepID=UPI001C0C69D5|nr:WG repeat-containing protein [Clostridium bowmanii]MBU3187988.1 WG repeat-containing protein [Clostridium bowmanii]MCA1072165.1 WG repeat-containing protein [Clostridium bowmanii]